LSGRPQYRTLYLWTETGGDFAAILNSGALIGLGVFLFKAAYDRFMQPEPIAGGLMFIVAVVGLVANVIGTLLLRQGAQGNMNIVPRICICCRIRCPVWPSSLAVQQSCGGTFPGLIRCDRADRRLYYLRSIEIVIEAVNVLLMGAPETVSLQRVQQELEAVPGVQNIHHVHVWRLNERIFISRRMWMWWTCQSAHVSKSANRLKTNCTSC
jgi:cobalt-zinc-cadmium efflux system protein